MEKGKKENKEKKIGAPQANRYTLLYYEKKREMDIRRCYSNEEKRGEVGRHVEGA